MNTLISHALLWGLLSEIKWFGGKEKLRQNRHPKLKIQQCDKKQSVLYYGRKKESMQRLWTNKHIIRLEKCMQQATDKQGRGHNSAHIKQNMQNKSERLNLYIPHFVRTNHGYASHRFNNKKKSKM